MLFYESLSSTLLDTDTSQVVEGKGMKNSKKASKTTAKKGLLLD